MAKFETIKIEKGMYANIDFIRRHHLFHHK